MYKYNQSEFESMMDELMHDFKKGCGKSEAHMRPAPLPLRAENTHLLFPPGLQDALYLEKGSRLTSSDVFRVYFFVAGFNCPGAKTFFPKCCACPSTIPALKLQLG